MFCTVRSIRIYRISCIPDSKSQSQHNQSGIRAKLTVFHSVIRNHYSIQTPPPPAPTELYTEFRCCSVSFRHYDSYILPFQRKSTLFRYNVQKAIFMFYLISFLKSLTNHVFIPLCHSMLKILKKGFILSPPPHK